MHVLPFVTIVPSLPHAKDDTHTQLINQYHTTSGSSFGCCLKTLSLRLRFHPSFSLLVPLYYGLDVQHSRTVPDLTWKRQRTEANPPSHDLSSAPFKTPQVERKNRGILQLPLQGVTHPSSLNRAQSINETSRQSTSYFSTSTYISKTYLGAD